MHHRSPGVFLPCFCIPYKSVGDRKPIKSVDLSVPADDCIAGIDLHTTAVFPSFLPYYAPFHVHPYYRMAARIFAVFVID